MGLIDGGTVEAARGAVRSWTVWLGTAMVAMPELWPALEPLVTPLIGEVNGGRVTQLVGILVILLRYRTDRPLGQLAAVPLLEALMRRR
jgi:hypothetical protein